MYREHHHDVLELVWLGLNNRRDLRQPKLRCATPPPLTVKDGIVFSIRKDSQRNKYALPFNTVFQSQKLILTEYYSRILFIRMNLMRLN